jgi:hypothetical protein
MTANNEDVKVKSREKVCAYRELKLGGTKARGCGAHIHRAAEKAHSRKLTVATSRSIHPYRGV